MVKFPYVLPVVHVHSATSHQQQHRRVLSHQPTLSRHRSLETWRSNVVAPITRCHSEDASKTAQHVEHVEYFTYNGTAQNADNTKMYEPIASTCATTILPRYPSDTNLHTHEVDSFSSNPPSLCYDTRDESHLHQKDTKNISNRFRTFSAPEKPPRRIKLQKLMKQNNQPIQEVERKNSKSDDANLKNGDGTTILTIGGDDIPVVKEFMKEPPDEDITDVITHHNNHHIHVDLEDINRLCVESEKNFKNRHHLSVGIQVSPLPPYRLRLFPKRFKKMKGDPEKCDCNKERIGLIFTWIGRWIFCQFGLTIIIIIWALLGAAAFYYTEGPREQEQAEELATLQYNLAINLATELRQVVPHEPVWLSMVQNYFAKHESLLLNAVSAGYGEGGGGGHIWTYPGCVLFSVSLLTTLGFGAPVPRTTLGRGAAVLFSAIGIPLHFLLVLNIGVLIASKLQAWSIRRANGKQHQTSCTSSPLSARSICSMSSPTRSPAWLKWLPVISIAVYYVIGVILFGFVRQRNFADSLLFPLDFTATGGVAKTLGHVRVLYALYLELAVTLAATMVSLLQVSASKGILNLGLKLGLLTNHI